MTHHSATQPRNAGRFGSIYRPAPERRHPHDVRCRPPVRQRMSHVGAGASLRVSALRSEKQRGVSELPARLPPDRRVVCQLRQRRSRAGRHPVVHVVGPGSATEGRPGRRSTDHRLGRRSPARRDGTDHRDQPGRVRLDRCEAGSVTSPSSSRSPQPVRSAVRVRAATTRPETTKRTNRSTPVR